MLKYAGYDLECFQEIPDEVTLALNLVGCPERMPRVATVPICNGTRERR